MTAKNESPSGASTAKGRTAKPLDALYSFTTGAEIKAFLVWLGANEILPAALVTRLIRAFNLVKA